MKVENGVSCAKSDRFRPDDLTFSCVKERGSVVSEGPAMTGREFFPFGFFEHRIMASWGGYTPTEVRLTPAEIPVPVRPVL